MVWPSCEVCSFLLLVFLSYIVFFGGLSSGLRKKVYLM